MPTTPTIGLPNDVVDTLARLEAAIPRPVVLVGGWAVRCRLQMARSEARPTDDVDIVVPQDARPARAALDAIDAIQSDPDHPCRLEGLPLLVDLLADDVPAAVGAERITDSDGLNLLIPPFATLLSRTAEPVVLAAAGGSTIATIRLPLAGSVFAAKVANLTLELRDPDKRATDGEDVVRLLIAFGQLALLEDLRHADAAEVAELRRHLTALGGGGISGQARVARFDHDERRVARAVERILEGLA